MIEHISEHYLPNVINRFIGKIYGRDKKTTHADRLDIKKMVSDGLSQASVAKKYNLSTSTVNYIILKNLIGHK